VTGAGQSSARRIFGLETEFGLAFVDGELGPEQVARELFADVVAWGRSSNVFLGNAARLYLDVGSHPEYATAECDSLESLIAQDVAGARILAQMAARTQDRLAGQGAPGTVHLFKNNVDGAGNSFGCHENYLVRRSTDLPALHRVLIPFLVARQLLAGAGHVATGMRGAARYVYSQRADHVQESVSSSTTRSRPMINTRDEAHADGAVYRRLHVIAGDSSICQTTTLLKVGSTDLVLRLAEAGAPLPAMDLANPAHAIRAISHGMDGSGRAALADGRQASGADILEAYLECVETYLNGGGASRPTDRAVLDLWRRALAAARTGDSSAVETELDWAIKRRLIERYCERTGVGLADPRVARLELAYHDIGPDGLAARLEQAGAAARVVGESTVEAAIVQPPATTRAALRGRFIAAAQAAGATYSVDWVHLKLTAPTQAALELWDPFAADDAAVTAIVADLTAMAAGGSGTVNG
jgi:proteasome accessory factor A